MVMIYLLAICLVLISAKPCSRCNGKGSVKGRSYLESCPPCKGTGKIADDVKVCDRCNGDGSIGKNLHQCRACDGKGIYPIDKQLCPLCSGKGFVKAMSSFGSMQTVPCHICNSKGLVDINTQVCPTCGGRGYHVRNAHALPEFLQCSTCKGEGVLAGGAGPQGVLQTPSSSEIAQVKEYISKSQASKSLTLNTIQKIVNPQLEGAYRSSSNEKWLFHGSMLKSGMAIASQGYKLPTQAGMLGVGVYFGIDPNKSIQYCRDGKKTMLLNRVNLVQAVYHQNIVFDEYMIKDVNHALPLYLLTFK